MLYVGRAVVNQDPDKLKFPPFSETRARVGRRESATERRAGMCARAGESWALLLLDTTKSPHAAANILSSGGSDRRRC